MNRSDLPSSVTAAPGRFAAARRNPSSLNSSGEGAGFIVLDLKTTGFSPDRHEIIQIAATRLARDGAILEMFATNVCPQGHLPWHVTVLTGIRNADVFRAPAAPDALRALALFFGAVGTKRPGAENPLLVVHNGRRFALKFISTACARHALPVSAVRCIDSRHLAQALWPAERLHNLDAVAGRLGIDVNASAYLKHDARADVRLLATVVRRIVGRLHTVAPAHPLEAYTWEHEFVTTP